MNNTKNILQQNFKNFKQFIDEQGPSKLLLNYHQVSKIADVFQNTPITLKTITGAFSQKDAGYTYIHEWFKFLNDFLNIRHSLQPIAIQTLALNCYKKYSYFTLADLKLLLDFILESKYGTFYGSVDTQRILTSFSEYAKERKDFEDKLIQKERDKLKELEKNKEVTSFDPNLYPNVAMFFRGGKILK